MSTQTFQTACKSLEAYFEDAAGDPASQREQQFNELQGMLNRWGEGQAFAGNKPQQSQRGSRQET